MEFPVAVSVTVPELPAGTLTEVCAAPKVKVGAGATMIENAIFCIVEPLVAETLAVQVPAAAVVEAVSLNTLVPESRPETIVLEVNS